MSWDEGHSREGGVRSAWLKRVCALAALAVGLVLSTAPAQAFSQRGHEFKFAFGSSGPEPLTHPAGVAVDEAKGVIYVVDRAPGKRVAEFNLKGEPIGVLGPATPPLSKPDGVAVDNNHPANPAEDPSTGAVYVVDGSHVDKFSPAGTFIRRVTAVKEKEFGKIMGIAVDATGKLWVDWSEGQIVAFTNGEPNKKVSLEPIESGATPLRPGLAVDSHEGLFVSYEPGEAFHEEGKERPCEKSECFIAKLASIEASGLKAGEPINSNVNSGEITGLAADLSNNNLYAAEGTVVAALDSNGTLIQRFGGSSAGGGELKLTSGIAIDSATQTVYVVDTTAKRVDVFPPEEPGPPAVEEPVTQALTSTAATLSAVVDPKGAETTVTLEYCAEASCITVPVNEGKGLGSGFAGQTVSVSIGELKPATAYRFKFVAQNGHGSGSAEGVFTTQGGFALADNRAWELVSPAVKNGAGFESIPKEGGLIQASADGNSITYIGTAPPEANPEGNRSPTFTQNFALRSGGGSPSWSSKDIAIPNEKPAGAIPGHEQEYRFFTADLSQSLIEPTGAFPQSEPPLSKEASEKTIYVRGSGECPAPPLSCYQPVVTANNTAPGTHFGGKENITGTGIVYQAASPDLSHVALRSEVPLTTEPAAPPPEHNLYMWSAATKQLRLINVLPAEEGGGPAKGAGVGTFQGFMTRHAVSTDGSRVVWSTASHIYLRDLTGAGHTTQLDRPEVAVTESAGPTFQTATADASRIFFTDATRLTANSTGSVSAGNQDLYEFSLATGKLTDLSVDPNFGQTGEGAAVRGFLPGMSEESGNDGNTIYFVANGVLTTSENARHEKARTGSCGQKTEPEPRAGATCNLYVEHYNGEAKAWGPPELIAVLSDEDLPDWQNSNENLKFTSSRVSPNGRFLAFMSNRPLTGYDNRDRNPTAGGARDEEVFLYDDTSKSLICPSCNPTGQRPFGVFDQEEAGEGLGLLVDRPELWRERWLAGNVPGWTGSEGQSAQQQSRYLSDNGRLFFNSADALVPQAVGQTRSELIEGEPTPVGVENVYQYESNNEGSCRSEHGCVSLLSSGTSARESAFLDASESGNDAFFLTASNLVPQDKDPNFDVYDARVCTESSPCVTPPPSGEPPCESSEQCKSAPTTAPVFAPPASGTRTGTGNLPPGTIVGQNQVLPNKVVKKLTRAQLLANALKTCRKIKKHKPRVLCESRARKKYGAKKAKKARGKKR